MAKILSRLGIKRLDILLLVIFFTAAGVANTYLLVISNFTFMLAGAFASLSFMAAYGLFKTKKWAVWLVAMLFFPVATFGVTTLYFSIDLYGGFYSSVDVLLLHLAFLFYVILSFVSFVYVAVKRKNFQ